MPLEFSLACVLAGAANPLGVILSFLIPLQNVLFFNILGAYLGLIILFFLYKIPHWILALLSSVFPTGRKLSFLLNFIPMFFKILLYVYAFILFPLIVVSNLLCFQQGLPKLSLGIFEEEVVAKPLINSTEACERNSGKCYPSSCPSDLTKIGDCDKNKNIVCCKKVEKKAFETDLGKDYEDAKYCEDPKGIKYYDTCLDSDTLKEFFVEANACKSEIISCSVKFGTNYECSEGACREKGKPPCPTKGNFVGCQAIAECGRLFRGTCDYTYSCPSGWCCCKVS